MTKLAVVSMVRNECDIIELFARHTLQLCDKLFILDHLSSDATPQILNAIKQEGFNLEVIKITEPQFTQASFITSACRQIAYHNHYDYILPLDADEFIAVNNKNILLNTLETHVKRNAATLIPWCTCCPINGEYFSHTNPLNELFRPRASEGRQYYKVLLGTDFAKECTVEPGNHSALHPKLPPPNSVLPLVLQHVPVRSVSQIVRKALLGSLAYAITQDRRPGQGFHRDVMANLIRENGYKLSEDELLNIALRYSLTDSDPTPVIDANGRIVLTPQTTMRKAEYAEINLLADFDRFIVDLISTGHFT